MYISDLISFVKMGEGRGSNGGARGSIKWGEGVARGGIKWGAGGWGGGEFQYGCHMKCVQCKSDMLYSLTCCGLIRDNPAVYYRYLYITLCMDHGRGHIVLHLLVVPPHTCRRRNLR